MSKNLLISISNTQSHRQQRSHLGEITSKFSFSYVPVKENKKGIPARGRLNLTGQSVFYASFSPYTNLKEMKGIKEGEIVYVSIWEISANSGLSLYKMISPNNLTLSEKDIDRHLIITDPHIVNGAIGDYLRYLGGLLLKDESLKKNKYLTTAIIANKILQETDGIVKNGSHKEQRVSYDGIIYPSIEDDLQTYNIALKSEFIDKYATLKYVIEGQTKNSKVELDSTRIGICNGNIVEWYESYIYDDDIELTPYLIIDGEESQLTDSRINLRFENTTELRNVRDFLIDYLRSKGIFHDKISLSPDDIISNLTQLKNKIHIEEQTNIIMENSTRAFRVEYIKINVSYKSSLRKI